MSKFTFTPDDIIKAYERNTRFIKLSLDDIKDNGKKSTITYYINILAENEAGAWIPLKLVVRDQILGGSAKKPPSKDDEDKKGSKKSAAAIPAKVQVSFREMKEEDLKITKHNPTKWAKILELNKSFIQALSIINKVLVTAMNEMIDSGVLAEKGVKLHNSLIRELSQIYRDPNPSDDKKHIVLVNKNPKILLPTPLYRLSLPVDGDTGFIQKKYPSKDKKSSKIIPVVFDIRRTNEARRENVAASPVEAKALNKKAEYCVNYTYETIGQYVTCFSMVTGIVHFSKVCLSSMGVSILNEFSEMYVNHHPAIQHDGTSNEDLQESELFAIASDDVTLDSASTKEPSKSSKKTGKIVVSDEEDSDVPSTKEVSDSESDDSETKAKKAKKAKKAEKEAKLKEEKKKAEKEAKLKEEKKKAKPEKPTPVNPNVKKAESSEDSDSGEGSDQASD